MSSPNNENEEVHSTVDIVNNGASGSGGEGGTPKQLRPPAKRPMSAAVIEISDTESDDSDVCAVNSYQATADEVKRIRGAEYSSSSSTSSSDYSSDSESPWEDDSIVLESEKVNIKVPRAQLNPRANRMDVPKINPKILAPELIDQLSNNWKEFQDHIADAVTLTCDPFRVCLLHDLLHNSEIINNIVDDMNTLDWNRKKMDLYEFHQTADLASLTWQRSIRGIYDLLKTELMTWVSKVTGLELTSVSASCSLYGPGDHLLVHDDLLGDRRVAFILYLAPWKPRAPQDQPIEINGAGDDDVKPELRAHGWAARLGGALRLRGAAGGRPARVRRRVFPRNNMMALFPVGSDSFHEVGEVLSLELPRLSINGWFHGPPPLAAPAPAPAAADAAVSPPPDPAPPDTFKPHNEVVVLSAWLAPAYMAPRARAQVQAQMEANSEVCLTDILAPDQALRLLQHLEDPAVSWEEAGPADQRHYQRWTGGAGGAESVAGSGAGSGAVAGAAAGAADPVTELTHLLSSVAWTRFLADCTDLTVTAHTKPEVQRWRPGDYTLLPPRSHYLAPRLQAVLYVGCRGTVCGGATTYVAPEDSTSKDSALVSVPPRHNALSLVYCDAGAASFTKYFSRMTANPSQFYIITATYYE